MSKKYNGKDMAKSSRFIEYLKTMSEVDKSEPHTHLFMVLPKPWLVVG